MQISYTIYEQRVTPDFERDAGEEDAPPEVVDSGRCGVLELLRTAVDRYGITPRAENDGTLWYCSETPPKDREFFEKGVEKYYSLHIHSLLPRHFRRINRMLKMLWKEA